MNYEEKLKLAREALKSDSYDKKTIEYIFPELKESEDEKIRKRIILCLEECVHNDIIRDYEKDECLAWLEKQAKKEEPQVYETKNGEVITYSESKGYEVVEPEFKVGDWIVDNCGYLWRIEGIINQFYILEGTDGCESRPTIERVNKTSHLWTIAKDGDVLQLGESTVIFKKYIGNRKCICYCSFCEDGGFEFPISNGDNKVYNCFDAHPATKEQRDKLEKAMADAGYTFDFEKKEFKEVEQKPIE